MFECDAYWSYVTICIVLAFLVRVIHCAFKAWEFQALAKSTDPETAKLYGHLKDKRFAELFRFAFVGGDAALADHWLGCLIGFVELVVYVPLLATGMYEVIMFWLGLKFAADFFSKPLKQQRNYNRLLVANLLNLGIAYAALQILTRLC